MAKLFRPCSVFGCNGNSHYTASGSRGYCSPHYARLNRHGDPLAGGPERETANGLEFLTQQKDTSSDDCLNWPFFREKGGYGQFRRNGKTLRAHRIMCALVHGDAPTSRHEAAHSCGKGHLGCVNPRHLRWATPKENSNEKAVHGTMLRGEDNGFATLTEADVLEIRRLRDVESQANLAVRFSTSPSNISAIQNGKRWAHLL